MLSGCAGFRESNHSVEVDNSTVDPELKKSLANARKLVFLGTEGAAELPYMAEYLELDGGYEVSIERVSSIYSPSQIRKLALKVCQRADKPDLVFSSSNPETDAGGGTTIQAVFTGRAEFDMNLRVSVLRCRDSWISKFSASVSIDQGIYNADQSRMSELLGKEYAMALLEMAGRGEHSSQASVGAVAADKNLVLDIQQALATTGHYRGVVDGLYGPQTQKAISDYQRSEGLSVTGEPSEDLLAHLKKD
jgi:hypothetical protein